VSAHVKKLNGAKLPDFDSEEINRIKNENEHHLVASGMNWRAFEDKTREVVSDYIGVRRSSKSLELAMQTLSALAANELEMKADDLHGLMRVNETKSIRLSAEVMANAAMARTESRTGSSHFRSDFPETNEKDWKKFVLVSKEKDRMKINFSDASDSLASTFNRGS